LQISELTHVLEVGHEHVVEIGNCSKEQKQQGHEHHRPRIGARDSIRIGEGRRSNGSSHTGRKVQKKPTVGPARG
jgi:hypothetical protein